nr:MAG TPA: hypothetical protein [Bacteriophage sp.]
MLVKVNSITIKLEKYVKNAHLIGFNQKRNRREYGRQT